MQRRRFLKTSLAIGALGLMRSAQANRHRVVIIGGGWGGLATANRLRQLAPAMSITLIETQASFRSLPLSNRWLVGLGASTLPEYQQRELARQQGWRFLQARAEEIDRHARTVTAGGEKIHYDWLVIAAGIREDFAPWFGVDRKAAEYVSQHFPAGFSSTDELPRLKAGLEQFTAGTLLMSIPPQPYRCPPAPYERAALIAWRMQQRGLKAKLVILDPNQPPPAFERLFRGAYRDWITYLPQARIRSLDPYARQVVTEFDTVDFDHAILMPQQKAGLLLAECGLLGSGNNGTRADWAPVDPLRLHVPDDPQVFLIGDQIDKVSPLFGHYPKTGQMAVRQGQIVARQIVAQAAGEDWTPTLPDSRCHVIHRAEPLEIGLIETHYRVRGDGLIQQTLRQTYNPQASDEDLRWGMGLLGELGLTPQ